MLCVSFNEGNRIKMLCADISIVRKEAQACLKRFQSSFLTLDEVAGAVAMSKYRL